MNLSFLRKCPHCGESFDRVDWLCSICTFELLQHAQLRKRQISPHIEHFYIFAWENQKLLKTSLLSLKGGGPQGAYSLLREFFPCSLEPDVTLYYPSKGARDHASELASVLADRWGVESHAVEKLGRHKQSLLTRYLRHKTRFSGTKIYGKQAHMVDDIVTSGGTAKAIHRALGRPAKMTVWSLFYRKYLSR